MKQRERQQLKKWDAYVKSLRKATAVDMDESPGLKQERIDTLLADPLAFFRYYFPHYCTSEFSDFQVKSSTEIISRPTIYAVLEWARGHAKSSTVTPMVVLYIAFRERDLNMLLVSHNETNAIDLLKPVKLELENNQRIISDFGIQKSFSSWEDKKFVTRTGCSFRAIGSGQSPRGTREQEVRPNMIVVDDIDEDEMLRNPRRLDQVWEWVTGALYNCFDISGKKRFVLINNRIAKDCVLVRAIDKADFHSSVNVLRKATKKEEREITGPQIMKLKRERKTITDDKLLRVYDEALKYLSDGFIPSWHQRYSMLEVAYMLLKIGYRMAQREYFNNPIAEGKVFKKEWMQWKKTQAMRAYAAFLVAYLDPGFKSTKTSDTKAWVLVGLYNGEFHIIKAFCDKATVEGMIGWGYELHKTLTAGGGVTNMRMEEVFLQSLLYKDFNEAAKRRGFPLPVKGDLRKKPDKDARIEALSGYFERGSIYFNEEERDNHHMLRLEEQFLNFEPGVKTHKDGPDAVEGAIFLLNQMMSTNTNVVVGHRPVNKKRV